jgi:hypothetical protein
VALVTNGVLLPGAPAELWERIDRVVVSLYAGHDLDDEALTRCRSGRSSWCTWLGTRGAFFATKPGVRDRRIRRRRTAGRRGRVR